MQRQQGGGRTGISLQGFRRQRLNQCALFGDSTRAPILANRDFFAELRGEIRHKIESPLRAPARIAACTLFELSIFWGLTVANLILAHHCLVRSISATRSKCPHRLFTATDELWVNTTIRVLEQRAECKLFSKFYNVTRVMLAKGAQLLKNARSL